MSTPDPTVLLSDTFDRDDLAAWTSYVGGENESSPTWRIESGTLVQPFEDGLIRAILTGDATWCDYSVEARVRIDSSTPESRAGLVFRDDGRGFYVLRFTRSSGRAQLMYHSRAPFGWHELATVPVPASCREGNWVSVKVEARGPFIRCLLDGNQYIDLADSRSRSGRVGFYACEAKAAFEEFHVHAMQPLSMPPSRTGQPPYAPTVSFWFRETFAKSSVDCWELPPCWSISAPFCCREAGDPGASIATLRGAPFSDGLVQVRSRVIDGSLEVFKDTLQQVLAGRAPADALQELSQAGSRPATPNAARAGLFVRGQGGRGYVLALDRVNARLFLAYHDAGSGHDDVLGAVEFKGPIDDRWFTLGIQCKGPSFVVTIDGIPCLALDDRRHSTGELGLFADAGPAIFTDLLAASGK